VCSQNRVLLTGSCEDILLRLASPRFSKRFPRNAAADCATSMTWKPIDFHIDKRPHLTMHRTGCVVPTSHRCGTGWFDRRVQATKLNTTLCKIIRFTGSPCCSKNIFVTGSFPSGRPIVRLSVSHPYPPTTSLGKYCPAILWSPNRYLTWRLWQ